METDPGLPRFTDRARKVMDLAAEEAARMGDDHLDTHHVLLGIAKEGTGVGAIVLRNLNVSYERVRNAVAGARIPSAISDDSQSPPALRSRTLPLTSDTEELVRLAAEEGTKLNHRYVGTEHLLLGLCRQSNANAVLVLRAMGIDPATIRSDVCSILWE